MSVGSKDCFGPLRWIQSTSILEFQRLDPVFDTAGPAVLRRANADSSCSLSRNTEWPFNSRTSFCLCCIKWASGRGLSSQDFSRALPSLVTALSISRCSDRSPVMSRSLSNGWPITGGLGSASGMRSRIEIDPRDLNLFDLDEE